MNREVAEMVCFGVVAGILCSVAAVAQSSSAPQGQVSPYEAQIEQLTAEIITLDQQIEGNVNDLVGLLSSVRDSTETGTQIVRTKEEALAGLKRSIEHYQRQRVKVQGQVGTVWRQMPDEDLEQDMKILDEKIEQRIAQIVEVSSSLTQHQDFEKYTYEPRTQIRNYKKTVSDDYRSNQKVTARSEPAREKVIEKAEDSVADLEQQARALEQQITMARTEEQRAALEAGLASVNDRLAVRREQVGTVAAPYAPATSPVSKDAARDIDARIGDEVAEIRKDQKRLVFLKSELDRARGQMHAVQNRMRLQPATP